MVKATPAADKNMSQSSSPSVPRSSGKQSGSGKSEESPVTPLQADLTHPRRRTCTPSDSAQSSDSAATLEAQATQREGFSEHSQPVLEARFEQVDADKHADDDDCSSSSATQHLPQTEHHSAVATAEHPHMGSSHPQLSPPQSPPSTPTSHISTQHDSNGDYSSVTHVNTCYAKSDEKEDHDDMISSSKESEHAYDCAQQATAGPVDMEDDGEGESLLAVVLDKPKTQLDSEVAAEETTSKVKQS